MVFKYRDILGEIIFAYVAEILYISYTVAEISKFSDNPEECHYVAIKKVVRYLRKNTEKGIIWLRKEPKTTLLVGSIIPKVEMDTQIPGEINPCEAVNYIDASHATLLRSKIYKG